MLSEHLHTRDYPDFNPIPLLESYNNFESLKELYNLPEDIELVDDGFFKKDIEARYLEGIHGAHERGILINQYMSKRIQEEREKSDGPVCYLAFSHGNIVEQMGNLN